MTETLFTPRTRSEGVRALRIQRGTGEHRTVIWNHINTRISHMDGGHRYEIKVKEGNELLVKVYSGIPSLTVVPGGPVSSGKVTVEFSSVWGNSLTIAEGAEAHVIVPQHRYGSPYKVTINNHGTVTIDAPEENRVRVYGGGQVVGGEFPKGIFGALIDAAVGAV